jgi:predicted oxidoreductase
VPEAAPSLAELSAPRRTAIATLFREAWRTARELADLYAAFARRTSIGALRAALEELATQKSAHVSALAALAPVLDPEGGEGRALREATAARETLGGSRTDLFARAFEAESTLAVAFREIGALLGDPARCPALPPLAAQSTRHRSRLRELYLRYS